MFSPLKVWSAAECDLLINHGSGDYFTWQDIEQPDPDKADGSSSQLQPLVKKKSFSPKKCFCPIGTVFITPVAEHSRKFLTFLAANNILRDRQQNGNIYTMKAGNFLENEERNAEDICSSLDQTDGSYLGQNETYFPPPHPSPYLADHTIV